MKKIDEDNSRSDYASGPLSGIRVVDLTSVIMGPYATRILGDYGADIIKVESPDGDPNRLYKPSRSEDMSGASLNLNRNKRSLTLDLKRKDGIDVMYRLLRDADIFIHTLRPKVIQRLGLGYEAVRAINPDIIYCGAYGFSAAGPYGDKAAYDDLIQAGSGLAALYTRLSGEPAYAPTVLCDKLAGQTIVGAVLAALVQRSQGGGGQAVEVPMFESAVDFLLVEHLAGATFDPPMGQPGYSRLLTKYRRPYRARDGYIAVVPYTDRNWIDFFDFAGMPQVMQDPRFKRLAERGENIEALYEVLAATVQRFSVDELRQACERHDIPFMAVLDFDDLREDPHSRATRLFTTMEHPTEGTYVSVRQPVTFSQSRFDVRRFAPKRGGDFREVLAELGYAEAEIETLGRSHLPKPPAPAAEPSFVAGEQS